MCCTGVQCQEIEMNIKVKILNDFTSRNLPPQNQSYIQVSYTRLFIVMLLKEGGDKKKHTKKLEAAYIYNV